jgi:predicted membrane protein
MTNSTDLRARFPAQGRLLDSGPARALSFLAASLFCLALIAFPQLVIVDGRPPNHGLLVLGLLGMAAGFVHGIGFVPRNRAAQLLFGPIIAWLLMGTSGFYIFSV